VVIWLEQASFLPFIYFQHLVEFVMFPSISRYNIGEFLGVITLISAIAGERRLKFSFLGKTTQF